MPHSATQGDVLLAQAEAEIASTYGRRASIGAKRKSLLKFGRTTIAAMNTDVTLATLGSGITNEVFVSSNLIDSLVCEDTSATNSMVIEGHYFDTSAGLIFSTQARDLDGQTRVALDPALGRCNRVFNNDTSGAGPLNTNVYVYQDGELSSGVPTSAAEIHCTIVQGKQQSEKAATTISANDHWIITQIYVAPNRNATASVDWELQVREFGKVFRPKMEGTVRTAGGGFQPIDVRPYIIAPRNSDVRLSVNSSANSTVVFGYINGYLAKDTGPV